MGLFVGIDFMDASVNRDRHKRGNREVVAACEGYMLLAGRIGWRGR